MSSALILRNIIGTFKFTRILLFVFLPSLAFGGTINTIAVSNSSPNPGSVIGVTITYCAGANIVPFFMVALNPSSTTLQACPVVNQVLLVDSNTAPTGVSPVSSSLTDSNDGNGWSGVGIPNSPPPCPYTQVFNVTIPASTGPGATNLIVTEGDYDVRCLGNNQSTVSAVLNIPLPPPNRTVTKSLNSVTAAPNGLALFDINYYFVNSTNCTLTDVLPPNMTFQGASNSALGTTNSPGAVTWNFGPVSTPIQGTAWVLASVNSGTAAGTTIINTASASTNEQGSVASNSVTLTVQNPQLAIMKSESAPSLAAGSSVTYTLNWEVTGDNLQLYDSYDNDPVGTSNGSIKGFDNTLYTQYAAQSGDLGSWSVGVSQGNNYIIGTTAIWDSGGGSKDYPALIRTGPGVNICSGFTVQGDLQIPSAAPGATNGDSAMVVAVNASQGVTMTVAISQNTVPDYLYFQKNQNYDSMIYPSPMGTNNLPLFPTSGGSPIIVGNWYTVNVNVQFSGSGPITYTAILWPTGIPSDAATFVYVDPNNASDYTLTGSPPVPNNPGTITGCSCGWLQGWQAYETTGTDYFANLQVYSGGSVVNATLTDAVPPGVTYSGASPLPTSGTPNGPLVWNYPALMINQCPVSWWGTVACPGPAINQFTFTDSVLAAPVTSNSVTLTVTGACNPTPTATNTPTSTVSSTATPSPTNTSTFTPSLTATPTITFTPTITPTPVDTATFTPTPVGLHVWPNPFDPKYAVGGFLKAYQVPSGSTMSFYTVSGELVRSLSESNGVILWDGRNNNGMEVSTGTYYYVIQSGTTVILTGKILVLITP